MTTLTVTTTADSGADTYDFGTLEEETADGGGLSLREAVGLASDELGLNTITFGGDAFSGELTTILLQLGDLFIDDDIIIDGDLDDDGDPDVAISGDANGDDATRILSFAGEAFTVTDAAANGADGDNSPIFFFDGINATIDGLVLTGGVNGSSGAAVSSSGSLTITNSLLAGNRTFSDGGAIETSGGLSVSGSAIVGNRADGSGGAVTASSAPVSIQSSTISDNRADNGGALAVFGGDLTLNGVTLFGNDALSDGGAIFSNGAISGQNTTIVGNSSGAEGGGVFALGDLSLQNVTVSGNRAASDGGGVAAIGPSFDLAGSIILGNESGGAPSEISGGVLNVTSDSIIGLELLATGEGLGAGSTLGPDEVTVAADIFNAVTDGIDQDGDGSADLTFSGAFAGVIGADGDVALREGGAADLAGVLGSGAVAVAPPPPPAPTSPPPAGPANDAPTIEIAETFTAAPGDQLIVPLTLDDDQTSLSDIFLFLSAVDSTLIPLSNYRFEGEGDGRQLVISIPDDVSGEVSFTVRATDTFGASAFDRATITIDDAFAPAEVARFFNLASGAHFYTIDQAERDALIDAGSLSFEGVGFSALAPEAAGLDGDGGAEEVYRFFNTVTGIHFYTTSEEERDAVIEDLPAFRFEGVGFSAYEDGDAVDGLSAVYRFFNTVTGGHFYTASEAERDLLLEENEGFVFEGVAFYAFADDQLDEPVSVADDPGMDLLV